MWRAWLTTTEVVEHLLTMEGVYRSMVRLNPAQQEVLALRFMGGLSSEEAGAVKCGRTSGAIRELQRTALKPESTEGRPWGQPLKEPAGAHSESGIMVLEQEPARKQGALLSISKSGTDRNPRRLLL